MKTIAGVEFSSRSQTNPNSNPNLHLAPLSLTLTLFPSLRRPHSLQRPDDRQFCTVSLDSVTQSFSSSSPLLPASGRAVPFCCSSRQQLRRDRSFFFAPSRRSLSVDTSSRFGTDRERTFFSHEFCQDDHGCQFSPNLPPTLVSTFQQQQVLGETACAWNDCYDSIICSLDNSTIHKGSPDRGQGTPQLCSLDGCHSRQHRFDSHKAWRGGISGQ